VEAENIAHPDVQDDNGEAEDDAHVQEDIEEENAHVQENNSEEVNGQEVEGIIEFNPDHIISDPGLRIPIDRFVSNIRGILYFSF
jgi:hypothetical protein